jgi:penicillin-binding protein 1B
LALVGGRDYRTTQFNRVTLAHRQPGSAFKPFVFLAALTAESATAPAFTLASFVEDEPITLQVGQKSWTPRNHDDLYEGRVTLRRALEKSLNAATVRVAETVGLGAVTRSARRLGITSDLAEVPAMALGAFEVAPLELARAYLPFANGGRRFDVATVVTEAYDADGVMLPVPIGTNQSVITPAEAYLVTSALEGVVDRGTATAIRAAGLSADVAGKTGTTNDGRDAWFVGYSTRLVALVWVGFDDGESHGLAASQVAVPIWADFMKQAIDAYPVEEFSIPEGISVVSVDITNGFAANRYCPAAATEYFLTGTEPPPCTEHASPIDRAIEHASGFWERFRGWIHR